MFNPFRKPIPGPRRKVLFSNPLKIWVSGFGTEESPFLIEPVKPKDIQEEIAIVRQKFPGLGNLTNLVSSEDKLEWFFFDAYLEQAIMMEFFGYHAVYGSKYFWDCDWVWRGRKTRQEGTRVVTTLSVYMIKLKKEHDYYFDHSAIFALDETYWLLHLSHSISQDMTNSYSKRPI